MLRVCEELGYPISARLAGRPSPEFGVDANRYVPDIEYGNLGRRGHRTASLTLQGGTLDVVRA